MKAVALIFARGGSKGLPGKNIRLFGGKPLIGWAIEHALAVKQIEQVIVSTDSESIATVARDYGAQVPFMRPAELAQDDSPEWLAWRHALDYLRRTSGALPEIMVSVPATAPLRLPIDIEACLNKYEEGQADIVITVTEAHRNPYFSMVTIDSDGTSHLVNPPQFALAQRQAAPVVYDMAGVCFIAKSEFVMAHDSIYEGRVKAVHVPVARAIDIDTLLDFQIAENVLHLRDSRP